MISSTRQRKDGTIPVEDEVRRFLRRLMKDSGKDRAQIAQEMTRLLGRPVTPSMLADFTRNGTKKRHVRFPLAWAKAFGQVAGSDDLVRSQLREDAQRALAFGELVLPWIMQRAAELANSVNSTAKGKAKPIGRSVHVL